MLKVSLSNATVLDQALFIVVFLALCFAGMVLPWPLVRAAISTTVGADWAKRANAGVTLALFAIATIVAELAIADLIESGPGVESIVVACVILLVTVVAILLARNEPFAAGSTFSSAETDISTAIVRRWHWVAICSGIALSAIVVDVELSVFGLLCMAAGLLLLGLRLYQRIGPAPATSGSYDRPVGQMIIATLANLGLAVASAACVVTGGTWLNQAYPSLTKPQLDGGTLTGGIAVLVLQAIVIPLVCWWRWSARRSSGHRTGMFNSRN